MAGIILTYKSHCSCISSFKASFSEIPIALKAYRDTLKFSPEFHWYVHHLYGKLTPMVNHSSAQPFLGTDISIGHASLTQTDTCFGPFGFGLGTWTVLDKKGRGVRKDTLMNKIIYSHIGSTVSGVLPVNQFVTSPWSIDIKNYTCSQQLTLRSSQATEGWDSLHGFRPICMRPCHCPCKLFRMPKFEERNCWSIWPFTYERVSPCSNVRIHCHRWRFRTMSHSTTSAQHVAFETCSEWSEGTYAGRSNEARMRLSMSWRHLFNQI